MPKKHHDMRSTTLASKLAIIASIALLQAAPAAAVELDATLTTSTKYESDALREDPNPLTGSDGSRADVTTSSGLELGFAENNQSVAFRGTYNFDYHAYENDTNRDRALLNGESELSWSLLPQRIDWLATHNIDEIAPDRLNADANSDDLERRQEFSTGPYVRIPVTGVDHLALNANYRKVIYDEPENSALVVNDKDSEMLTAGASWQHAFSRISTLVAGYQYQEFERDSSSQDIEFQRAYAGLTRTLRQLRYNVTLGGNSSKLEGQSGNNSLFYQADITHDNGARQLSASASRQRTESSIGINNLRFNGELGEINPAAFGSQLTQENSNVTGEADITFANLDYNSTVNCSRCSYGLSLGYVKADYENQPTSDEEVANVSLHYDYRITRNITAKVYSAFSQTDFTSLNLVDDYTLASLFIDWRASPELTLRFGGGYEQEDAETGSNYYNSFGSLGIRYKLLERR